MAPRRKYRPVIIETASDLRRGVLALRRSCPQMRRLHEITGDPPLRRFAPGFEGLSRIVVGQQLSIASASAIWQRTTETVTPFRPEVLLALGETNLRAAGLSRPKIRTLRALATAVADGRLDLDQLSSHTDGVIREMLTTVSGIGPWTADIYVMFCLGRADSWAPGDLALQLSVQSALALKVRPDPRQLEAIAERWRPWRSIAACLLWAYYAHGKIDPERPRTRKPKI
jgi:DNA-3-methyladenine glycosylase II